MSVIGNESSGRPIHYLDGRTLNNAGTLTLSSTNGAYYSLGFNNGAVLNNTGTFTMNGTSIYQNTGAAGTVNNAGTLIASAGGGFMNGVTFNNTSSVSVQDNGNFEESTLAALAAEPSRERALVAHGI